MPVKNNDQTRFVSNKEQIIYNHNALCDIKLYMNLYNNFFKSKKHEVIFWLNKKKKKIPDCRMTLMILLKRKLSSNQFNFVKQTLIFKLLHIYLKEYQHKT